MRRDLSEDAFRSFQSCCYGIAKRKPPQYESLEDRPERDRTWRLKPAELSEEEKHRRRTAEMLLRKSHLDPPQEGTVLARFEGDSLW